MYYVTNRTWDAHFHNFRTPSAHYSGQLGSPGIYSSPYSPPTNPRGGVSLTVHVLDKSP
jgi:hypothetical protein